MVKQLDSIHLNGWSPRAVPCKLNRKSWDHRFRSGHDLRHHLVQQPPNFIDEESGRLSKVAICKRSYK